MEDQWITSVGIDLGTSTTKLIVSLLRLARQSGATNLPRIEIVERKLSYVSPIYSTPFLENNDEIDVESIAEILKKEYKLAHIQPSEIKSGAIIITGETATKHNAERIVHLLAERAGDFVVATAGASLEALLAGKGSGAERRSKHSHGIVANIDIGGGTTNIALFQRGKLLDTITFHIGGRLLQLNDKGELTVISEAIKPWLLLNGYHLSTGTQLTYDSVKALASHLCRELMYFFVGTDTDRSQNSKFDLLLLERQRDYNKLPKIDEIMISGGIGELMKGSYPKNMNEVTEYGDFGPMLAHTLKQELANYRYTVTTPEQTVRATVIGAGMQSVEVSGATIHMDASLLPLRNIPILVLELSETLSHAPELLRQLICQTIENGRHWFNSEQSPPFAFFLSSSDTLSYSFLQRLADYLIEEYRRYLPNSNLIVVICENDIGKALGQLLHLRNGDTLKTLCIDQIRVAFGDYIDLGEPISNKMIPIVVKTLAFQQK